MRAPITLWCLLIACLTLAQRNDRYDKFPVASVQLEFTLPTALSNTQMRNLTEVIGQLGASVQTPLVKGIGIGFGAQAAFFDYDTRGFQGSPRSGSVQRWTFYGKAQYEVRTSDITFFELAFRAGTAQYSFATDSCGSHRSSGFFFSPSVGLYLMANKNLAFGFVAGYAGDGVDLSPDQFCLEALPNHRTGETEGPLRYFTLGVSVSARLRKGEEPQGFY